MRRGVFLILILFSFFLICPVPTLAANLTYASDYYLKGNDLVNTGDYAGALRAYQTARSMDERFYNEHYGISYQIGWVLNKLGRYDEALAEFRIAEKYRPEWVAPFAIYYGEGCVLAKLGKNSEALEAFDSALLYGQTNWYVLFNKGIVLSRMGRYADAATAFDMSRKAYGSYLPLLGSYQETAATYDRARGATLPEIPLPAPAVTGSPQSVAADAYDNETSVDLLMRTGTDFVARYQYENALVVFDRVLKIDPSNYRAMSWKANALANLGRYAEAEAICDKALIFMDYRIHETYYLDTQYQKAWVQARQEKYNDSVATYDKVFLIDPDIFRAHYDKAWVLAKQGKFSESVQEYNRSLDWEYQVRIESRSYTILGPLGTYQDVADAYDKTKNPGSSLLNASGSPAYDLVLYQTDFTADPGWKTSAFRLYSWDSANRSYHFRSESSPGYAEMEIPYTGTPFQLEFDITIPHADPGALVRFGISQYNISENSQKQMIRYNSQNVILAEFKSWRANTYRSIKDGDKSFQIYAIDSRRYASDPAYEGMCRINREESIAIPSFGENRIYHVFIAFDPDAETISTKVSDNLHEKTYYVCSGMLSKTGIFHDMNRLILVAEPAENAYIEGSIDNVVFSVPAKSERAVVPVAVTSAPLGASPNGTLVQVTSLAKNPVRESPPMPAATQAPVPFQIPSLIRDTEYVGPVLLIILAVIAMFIIFDRVNRKP